MNSHGVWTNRWLRRSLPTLPRQGGRNRRGQTLILAISILFLMMLLGGLFVTMVVRNLQRAGRQSTTDDALTLALAGIQYAAQQFRSSEQGADWRPKPTEILWRTPTPPPGLGPIRLNPSHPIFGEELDANELRQIDPDQEWLSDGGQYRQPYVRISTGRGRFLLRVTYIPAYQTGGASNRVTSEFDPNSDMIHIESIGRPGEFDPNDPTFFMLDTSETSSGVEVGPFRKVEAFIPMGMLRQLRWITNFTKERGPATLGVPSFVSGDGRQMTFPSVFQGSIRSDVDLQFQGRNVIRLYPARGDQLVVKGNILLSTRAQGLDRTETDEPPLRVEPITDTGDVATKPNFPPPSPPVIPPDQLNDLPNDDAMLLSIPINGDSTTPQYRAAVANSVLQTQGGDRRVVIRDAQGIRTAGEDTSRVVGLQPAPSLNQIDPTTGVERYVQITRDSGSPVEVQDTDGAGTRVVNSGAYGLTDIALPSAVRAKGLYLDNWDDIQIPTDRRRIKQIWMNPRAAEAQKYGWSDDYSTFLPKVDAGGVSHPIAEVLLTRIQFTDPSGTVRVKPVIRVTRYDKDVREMNLAPESGRSYDRKFYGLTNLTLTAGGGRGALQLIGQTRDFDWPENGIFYAEGSLRIRGMAGLPFDNTNDISREVTRPRPLTIVSNGSIYIEGNLQRENPGWQLGLFAHDFICLNPTLIQRFQPSSDVAAPVPNVPGDTTKGFHYVINQGSYMDFTLASGVAENVPANGRFSRGLLHVKHAGQAGETPLTAIVLNLPHLARTQIVWPDWNSDRYDFGTNVPPVAPPPPDQPYTVASALYYLFRDLSPGEPNKWNESDHRSAEGSLDTEHKTFYLPGLARNEIDGDSSLPRGMEATFRLEVAPKDLIDPALNGNDQPYWLSRLAITGADRPLPIRIEAVMYAFTGSWFVIPPPYFNDDDPADTRASMNFNGVRSSNTLPANLSNNPDEASAAQQFPFYNEPLNIDIQVIGSITENMPAEPSEVAEWTRHLWTGNLDVNSDSGNTRNADNDPSHWPVENPDDPTTWVNRGRSLFSPRLTYRYDYNLQRMARVRIVSTGKEEVVWTAPGAAPAGMRTLAAAVTDAQGRLNSYVETLPVLPRLPIGGVIYEGNPLQ